jgi:hypothetical protein
MGYVDYPVSLINPVYPFLAPSFIGRTGVFQASEESSILSGATIQIRYLPAGG